MRFTIKAWHWSLGLPLTTWKADSGNTWLCVLWGMLAGEGGGDLRRDRVPGISTTTDSTRDKFGEGPLGDHPVTVHMAGGKNLQ